MLSKIKRFIRKQLGVIQLIENQNQILEKLNSISRKEDELLKAFTFNNTISDSIWLKYKSFSPGGWAVDYSFLYTLYRVLNDIKPLSILEFGLGQSSKMIHQYVHFYHNTYAVTCEHDNKWIEFFEHHKCGDYLINVKQFDLVNITYNGEETLSYKNISTVFGNDKFELIIVDAPFGSKRYSRSQILDFIKNNLAEDFCIIIDDYNREGEKETVKCLIEILDNNGIRYSKAVYSGSKQHILICNEKLKFFTTL